jgi:hypothetical protein
MRLRLRCCRQSPRRRRQGSEAGQDGSRLRTCAGLSPVRKPGARGSRLGGHRDPTRRRCRRHNPKRCTGGQVRCLRRGYLQKGKDFLFCKYPGGSGAAPPSAEEEAKPDDETKDLRVSAPLDPSVIPGRRCRENSPAGTKAPSDRRGSPGPRTLPAPWASHAAQPRSLQPAASADRSRHPPRQAPRRA